MIELEELLREIDNIGREFITLPSLKELEIKEIELKIKFEEYSKFKWVASVIGNFRFEPDMIDDKFYIEYYDESDFTFRISFKNLNPAFYLKFNSIEDLTNAWKYLQTNKIKLRPAIEKYNKLKSIKEEILECEDNIKIYTKNPSIIYTKYTPKSEIEISKELIEEINNLYTRRDKT